MYFSANVVDCKLWCKIYPSKLQYRISVYRIQVYCYLRYKLTSVLVHLFNFHFYPSHPRVGPPEGMPSHETILSTGFFEKLNLTLLDIFSQTTFTYLYPIKKIKAGNLNSTSKQPCSLWCIFRFVIIFYFHLEETSTPRSAPIPLQSRYQECVQ